MDSYYANTKIKLILFVGNFLCKHGYNPTYLELLSEDLKQYPIHSVSTFKNKLLRLIHAVMAFYKNIFSIKLLVIDTYSTYAYYFALIISILSKLHRKPYILNLSGGNLENRLIKSYSFSIILKHSYLNISPSRFIYEQLQKQNIHSIYVPNYIDLEFYPYLKRSAYGPKLLWVRSLHKIYNPEMAIETLKLLQKIYPDCQLCMVGPDKDNISLRIKMLAEEYKLLQNLTLTGRISKSQIVEVSKNHDIFINTTDFDNLPITVLEAMALGLPIVSTNAGGLPHLLEESDSILVDRNDPDAMAESIIKIIQTPNLGHKLSYNARRKVEEKYSKKIINQKWSDIFQKFV